jgi:hypothetical protein
MTSVQVVAPERHAGLARDQTLIARTLAAAGFDVTLTCVPQGGLARRLGVLRLRAGQAWRHWRGGAPHRFDVNLMLERLQPPLLPLARRNALIPNPEWFHPQWESRLAGLDRVLVKTHHAEPIFAARGARIDYIGFTSEDRLLGDVEREPAFFHLAGRSGNKGTQPLIDLWLRKPAWPTLTVARRTATAQPSAPNLRFVTGFVDDDELRVLQNRHLFHLCPSETEGFGHYLVEAMSVGAIVLTTQAPPMDELVTAERGILVPYARTGTQRLATTYFVDAAGLEAGIERMLALSADERRTLGANARAWYEANDRAFRERLVRAVGALAASP